MKAGILTFHHSLNCGAVLQAYALQTCLRQLGFDAEVVNYGRIGWPRRFPISFRSVRSFVGSLLKDVMTVWLEGRRRRAYSRFLHEWMSLGPSVTRQDLLNRNYTHLISGSDQVWHPVINEGDSLYYLVGLPKTVRRISYAPSFGVDRLNDDLECRVSGWLKEFDFLSVREPQAANYVKRLCGRNAEVVCDPTMLLPAEHYREMEKSPSGMPDRYIAVYTICGHPWAEAVALKLGMQARLPVIHLVGGQMARWYLPGKVRRVTAWGPSEFLWFIRHAEHVVTNSFHGTVFSLHFHRPFTVALNGKPSDERMTNLLSGTRLEGRAVHKPVVGDWTDPDWSCVDGVCARKRFAGIQYLTKALA